MKNKKLIDSWRKIEPDQAAQERMLANILAQASSVKSQERNTSKIKKPFHRKRLLPAAACLVLIAAISIPLFNGSGGDFDLVLSKGNVKVEYMDQVPAVGAAPSLAWRMTEDELFHQNDTAIFMGTIGEIRNVQISFNSSKEYRAIAQIKVDKTYRGDCKVGDTVSVLLPGPIDTNVWVEDTGVTSAMRAGMTGIFMPIRYDETSYQEENGAKLYLSDIAEYGFLDGERYAFLDTGKGLLFAHDAYQSISSAASLEEIEQYIGKMIQ